MNESIGKAFNNTFKLTLDQVTPSSAYPLAGKAS